MLIVLGVYYIAMNLAVPVLDTWFPGFRLSYRLHKYLGPVIVAVLLIGGGIKLLHKPKRQELSWDHEGET